VLVLIGPLLSVSMAQSSILGWNSQPRAATDRATRDRAIRSIPMDKLDRLSRDKVASVLSKLTIFRRLPPRMIACDPALFVFLVEHPDVVVATWQALGLSEMDLRQIGPNTYRLTDQAGTDAVAEFIYRGHGVHVAYVEGACGGPLFATPARGSSVLILRSGYVRGADGRCYVSTKLDAFVRLDNGGLELLAKAFQPVIGRVVDNNFTQTIGFVGCLSRTAEVNLKGMKRLASRLISVDAPVREQFGRLAERVSEKAAELSDATVSSTTVAKRSTEGAN
jgi:hypothetical protein